VTDSPLHPDAIRSSDAVVSVSSHEASGSGQELHGHALGAPFLSWRRCSCGLILDRATTVCPIAQAYAEFLDAVVKARRISAREAREYAQARFGLGG
jgi:hypothetical protein